jgi:hypothetical protein
MSKEIKTVPYRFLATRWLKGLGIYRPVGIIAAYAFDKIEF